MGKIASSTSSAGAAIVGITSIAVQKGQQVSLGKSTISSMKTGIEINNQLLTDFSELVECVKKQSEKFPKIAELIALRDSQIKFEGSD
ncbi:hypothetical protein [Enterococcus termitis]|uniref:Type VII secretion effector n=1 Tax=Enterococcus termitis TaxID=332950 RepID=A0A1E5GHZ9_9ENTE|nr:hypothetical protein [Enterococcus termitis]OEG12309.1 hypothetical protein BCR25_07135 [Enterococcus termitis]OJG98871.1 hypothetical protein RV18_GL002733 [Enterococcus termitis]